MNGLELLCRLADARKGGEVMRLVLDWQGAGCPGVPLQQESAVDDGLWLCLCDGDENTCTGVLERCEECGASRPDGVLLPRRLVDPLPGYGYGMGRPPERMTDDEQAAVMRRLREAGE